MSTESLPKEFKQGAEVLPISKYGVSSHQEFRKDEEDMQQTELLKRAGLSHEEIQLYHDNEAQNLGSYKKIEPSALKDKLEYVYGKIKDYQKFSSSESLQPSTSKTDFLEKLEQEKSITFYPEGHPMNEIKEIEENLLGHLKTDIIPINKRRKMLRHLERRKERILAQQKQLIPTLDHSSNVSKAGSLWDVKDMSLKKDKDQQQSKNDNLIGPKKQTLYTIKDSKIVRLEAVNPENRSDEDNDDEYRAVDIVEPINPAEEELLEGTKMSIEDIKKIDRFKDYEPGVPSKVLYIKNISPSVTEDQLQLLFIQFQLENGGPVDINLMSGRMRGQAFASFQTEEVSIKALEEVNGTILSGKPLIVQFGRNSNRIQDDNR